MYSKRIIEAVRWLVTAYGLGAIVALFTHFSSTGNSTTAAMVFLLFVLVLAGNFGLRYAVAASIVATGLFNYFFLPPTGTLTIADTRNWIALFAFLATAIYAAHLAARIREESEEAKARRRESEMLYSLGRQLLQPENVAELLNAIPSSVANAFNSPAVTLYLGEGDRIYLSDPKRISSPYIRTSADGHGHAPLERPRAEVVKELRETMMLPMYRPATDGFPTAIPLRMGVRPSGAILMEGVSLSREAMEGISGLVAMSMERAAALENSTRSDAARETERLRTALLDSVTHELRTPLTSIKASISSLLSQGSMDEASRQELLTVIDEESDRLNHLIEQAVEMAQLDANRVQLEPRATAVASLFEDAIAHAAENAPGREIRTSIPAQLVRVLADVPWINRVMNNLVENAVKYSPAETAVVLSAERQGDFVAISVADRGIGIDPIEHNVIFEKFYRGQGQRARVTGTGMGLAICRAIVNAHGGTISVVSQLNHGSVFTFTLPIAR